ncbi:hypothetical protein TNCV_4658551 [Trichonephila clavipes]|nr:hypothetical protein TNCV_4658551 [Trichonephila clavipes]
MFSSSDDVLGHDNLPCSHRRLLHKDQVSRIHLSMLMKVVYTENIASLESGPGTLSVPFMHCLQLGRT